jgi:ankyrin repeat protein
MISIQRNHIKIANFLLQQPKIDLHISNKHGDDIFSVCISCNKISFLKKLSKIVEININKEYSANGMTLLHFCISYKSTEALKFLLDFKEIDVNKKNIQGYAPIHFAIRFYPKGFQTLLNHPDINLDITYKDQDLLLFCNSFDTPYKQKYARVLKKLKR